MKTLLTFTCLLCLWCASALAENRILDNQVWYRLHLGMGIGTSVSPDVIQNFLAKEVTPRFPDGLTITPARGQWNSPNTGLIRERVTLVDIQCPDTDAYKQKIEEISKAYVKRFAKAKASIYVVRVPGVTTTLAYE